MQYLDVTRFMFSVPEPPTAFNSIVLQDSCYSLNSTGYPIDINSSTTVVPDFDKIQFVTIRIDVYSFAIQQLWSDLESILNNNTEGLWLTIINLTEYNIYQQLFDRLNFVCSKPVYLQILDTVDSRSYTVDSIVKCVAGNFNLVDIHYYTTECTTLFVPLVPLGTTVLYNSSQPGVLLED